jgi:cephalosporin hydroxylase
MSQKQKSESETNPISETINGTEVGTVLPKSVDKIADFEKQLLAFEPSEYLNIRTPFGFFDYDDLYKQFVNSAKNGDMIVEIGSWVGKSTVYMAELVRFARSRGKEINFVNIDPFIADCIITADGYRWVESSPGTKHSAKTEFFKNIEPLKDYVRTIEGFSVPVAQEFADGSVFAVWVDGHHSYESVLADMEAWYPKVRQGGVLAGHDYVIAGAHPGFEVARAVETFVHKYALGVYREHKSWVIYK